MLLMRKRPWVPNKEWNFATGYIRNGSYLEKCLFLGYWQSVSFYSDKQLREVPVMGVLFPVKLFDEEEV
jgi:hypothetical protein